MTTRRATFLILTAFLIIVGSYAFTAGRAPAARQETVNGSALDGAPGGYGQLSTAQLLDFWRARVEADPRDYISMTLLGQTFLRQARETGDTSNLARAEAALQGALAINPRYEPMLTYLAVLRYTQHDFVAALDLATRSYASDPRQHQALATIGDAQLELGRYDEAAATFRALAEKAPGPAADSRLSRLAWLRGQTGEALSLAQGAVEEAQRLGLQGESLAWYHFQLGELLFSGGRYDEATQQYEAAGARFPSYYLSFAGIGKARAAQGRYPEAITSYERAVAIVPHPDLLAALGDLYTLTGRTAEAAQQYETIEFIGKLEAMNEVLYNRQLVIFRANHDRLIAEAVAAAEGEYATRRDIFGADALAWALYKAGRYDEAATYSDRALALGTRDAALRYHAGMIAARRDDPHRARQMLQEALAINPGFDPLQATVARQMLAELGTP